jgi:hypothetical protein
MEIERESGRDRVVVVVVVGLARPAPRDPNGRPENERETEKYKEKRKEKKREMFSYVYGHTQTIYTIYIHVTYLNRYIPAAVAAAEAAAVENDVTP